jgi:hypothetical protein
MDREDVRTLTVYSYKFTLVTIYKLLIAYYLNISMLQRPTYCFSMASNISMTHKRPIVMHNRELPTEVWSSFKKAHLISMHCKAALRGTCDSDEIRKDDQTNTEGTRLPKTCPPKSSLGHVSSSTKYFKGQSDVCVRTKAHSA